MSKTRYNFPVKQFCVLDLRQSGRRLSNQPCGQQNIGHFWPHRFIFRSWNMKQRTKKKTFLFEMLKIVRLSFVEIVLHLLLKMPKIRLSKWKNVSLVQLWSGSFSRFFNWLVWYESYQKYLVVAEFQTEEFRWVGPVASGGVWYRSGIIYSY